MSTCDKPTKTGLACGRRGSICPQHGSIGRPFDPEVESERLREEIEEQYPPSRCSLEQYRAVLQSLISDLRERVSQLDDELRGR